jgi:glycine betaine/proline transport system substrate-binding protein
MRRNRWLCFAALLVGIALIAGCAGGEGEQAGETGEPAVDKTADLVYVNWAEGVAYTHLAKVILEEQMNYDVTITAADVAPAYAAVAQGDKDAFMETWLPVLHKDYIEKYKDQVVDLGHVYEGTQSGLVVPSYVTIDTISALNDQKDKFDGKITGIDAGAGIMKTTEEQVIPKYDLELELVASSGPAMTAALQKAVNAEDWIVVTGWKPHWMFGRWDLKFLKQDKETVWEKGNIHIMGRKNLEQDKPELAQFLRNFFFTDAQLADLMIKVKEMEDPEAAARTWMNENMDVVQSFIP